MAKKKPATKKKKAVKKKSALKKKTAAKNRPAGKKKVVAKKNPIRPKQNSARAKQQATFPVRRRPGRGLDSISAGQSGDTQGLSRREDEDSESVEELTEEGQYFEAEAVSGVENAKDPDQGEVTTSEVPEDDVPSEYTDED
ncbi:MAG TPA: hypothetical protein VIX19_16275 [Terriglobales bacterium]